MPTCAGLETMNSSTACISHTRVSAAAGELAFLAILFQDHLVPLVLALAPPAPEQVYPEPEAPGRRHSP